MAGTDDAPTDESNSDAAQRIAVFAGVCARLAAASGNDLDGALAESLEDALLYVDAHRWTFVFHPGRSALGAPVTSRAIEAVEIALRSDDPVVISRHADGIHSVAAAASVGGSHLGVLIVERDDDRPWSMTTVGFLRCIADVAGAAVARRDAENHLRRSDNRYQRLLETSGEGVCLLGADGAIRFANRAFSRLVGEPSWPLVGVPITDYLADPAPAQLAARLLHESTRLELELVRIDGTRRWVSCATSALREDVEEDSCALVIMTDISMRRAAEAALRSSEARFRALIRSSSDVIIITDEDGLIVYASPSVVEVLGHDPVVLHATSPFDLVHPDDREGLEREVRSVVEARTGSMIVQCRVLTSKGDWRHMEAAITNLMNDADVRGMTITARDVTAAVELQANLAHAATHDGVTGLPNRRVMTQRLGALLRADDPVAAVLFADLDGFKRVNDEHGHDAGDELLHQVAARLQHAVRDGDLVVRHGGDEFAIVCPGVATAEEARQIAERVLDIVREPFALREGSAIVGVSVGVALSSRTAPPTVGRLVAAADAAMYRAKSRGNAWELSD